MSRNNPPSARNSRSRSPVSNASFRTFRIPLNSNSPSSNRMLPATFRSASARRTNSRLNASTTPGSIIMTKAQQQRRRNNMVTTPSGFIRSISAAADEAEIGVPVPAPTRARRRIISRHTNNNTAGSGSSRPGSSTTGDEDTFHSRADRIQSLMDSLREPRIIRRATRILTRTPENAPLLYSSMFDHSDHEGPGPSTTYAAMQYINRSKHRVKFDFGKEYEGKDSVSKVLTSEKILPKILSLMNWNELLPLRSVCKAWFQVIESHPKVNSNMGIIVMRSSAESKMAIYNSSSVTWKKFRFIGPIIFDMTKSTQNEFWNKHGPLMLHLDIFNRAMTLTALVEILARCPKLEYFKCNWTPEMYSFNSELIKKYYGIHFNNGTFANLQELTIDSSTSLTDSALWSILKWCGGSINSLKLTSTPDEDILTRLKPRWTVDSLKNYFDRFGYTGNLQYLDFSWSNLANEDMRGLCSITINLKGITLNYCKLDDEALRRLLQRHGSSLEVFKIEGTTFSDALFARNILPNVKVLHIGGLKGTVSNLGFLRDMPSLEELSCRNTQWLEQSMVLRPFNSIAKKELMKSIDFSGGLKYAGNKNLDPNLNKIWFSDFTGLLGHLKELNLSGWSSFGTNQNFQNICQTLPLLEKLVVREWDKLSDGATTGLMDEEIHRDWGSKVPSRQRLYIGSLKHLKHVDLSGTFITDATLFLALPSLKNLRSLGLDSTRITDNGLRGMISKIPTLDKVSVFKCPRISIGQPRYQRPDGRMVFFGKI